MENSARRAEDRWWGEDQELLEGISRRDPEAFRELMERYAGPVTAIAFRFLGSRPDAEEAAQDVFLRLYQRPPHLAPEAKLFTWIYRVTVNRCLDLLRGRRRAPVMLSLEGSGEPGEDPPAGHLAVSSAPTPREQVARSEMYALTRRAVASLPEKLRSPLLLSTVEELSQEEVGRILRISPKAVERRIHRARELLKARLAPHL